MQQQRVIMHSILEVDVHYIKPGLCKICSRVVDSSAESIPEHGGDLSNFLMKFPVA